MNKLYSTTEAAKVCKVAEATILAWAGTYGLGQRRDGRGSYGFTPQDLAVMKGKRPLAQKGDFVFARVMGEGVHAPLSRNLKLRDQYAKVKVNGRVVQVAARTLTLV